jgi:hypothetical protein
MYRVMRIHEFGDAIYYRIACDCGEPNCDLTIEFEYDKDLNHVNLIIYKNLRASAHWGGYWNHFDFIRVFWNKIKMMWAILTRGYIEVCEGTLLTDFEHIDNFIKALQEGKKRVQPDCVLCPDSRTKAYEYCENCGKNLWLGGTFKV